MTSIFHILKLLIIRYIVIYSFDLQRSATFYYEQRPLLEASHDTLMKNPEVDLNYVQDVLCKDVNITVL